MSLSLAVFLFLLALGTGCAIVSVISAAQRLGARAAAKYAAVLALSLAAWAATGLYLGYGPWPQCLAFLAGCLPLWLGHRYLPSMGDMRGDY